jgi:hypothetical protein
VSPLILDRSMIYFHKLDEAIRRAAAARKRGDFEQDEFWKGKVREYAEMHGKERLNASERVLEETKKNLNKKPNYTSKKYRQNAIQKLRSRSHGNTTP